MYKEIFTGLFQSFLDKNPILLQNSTALNISEISFQSEKNLYNIIPYQDMQYFNELKYELKNPIIGANIHNIYCLLFNECVNINNDIAQKKVICSLLKNYLSNIIVEINDQLLRTIADKHSNNGNSTKSQRNNPNKKNLKNTIKLLFLSIVFMLNKFKKIIDNTFEGYIIKGINVKSLKTNKVREEIFFLLILHQNLYWMNLIIEGILTIFQNLKNNKFRELLNTDTTFNDYDANFKNYCYECFFYLFNIVKKYSSLKLNDGATQLYDFLFNTSFMEKNNSNNYNNIYLPLDISKIDCITGKMFECFIYGFLFDIDAVWRYFDNLNFNNSDNYGILYGFGTYLCEFLKMIVFVRNENLSKVDFFNFYYFSYKLMTNYFSKLNSYLYELYNKLSDIIKNYPLVIKPDINLNYMQNLSNSLNDLLFNFMISSYNNDTLKDSYSFNEILINSMISHCFIKSIISIYSLIVNGEHQNLPFEIMSKLLDNINKYKIILPLKSHFYKELITHNYLLILDEFLVNNEKELILHFKGKHGTKKSEQYINNLINKYIDTLSCLFNHYNVINFLYSNHIIFQLNKILSKSGLKFPELNSSNTSNIFLRYIFSNNNFLHYKDIPISELNLNEKIIPNFRTNSKHNTNNFENNEINSDDMTINKEINANADNIGFDLDEYLDKNKVELFNNINIDGYEYINYGYKSYLMKNSTENNYSIIFCQNDGFVEKLGIDENLKENILNIMENNQYTDKTVFKFIQEKVINPENRNICINNYFYENIKYYDLKFEMNYFDYQNQIKELLI